MTDNRTERKVTKLNCDLRPDAQAFDEVRIITAPRYKTSGLSGDEWRISATIQLLRKGKVIVERGCGKIEYAVQMLPAVFLTAQDDGHAYFAGDGIHCDQEGCSDAATVRYRKRADYCRSGHMSVLAEPSYRHFCDRHKVRGDCGMDDADRNYVEEPML